MLSIVSSTRSLPLPVLYSSTHEECLERLSENPINHYSTATCSVFTGRQRRLGRIWYYISYPLPFFNDRVSVGRVVLGIAIIFITLSLAGRFSSLLHRRLEKRRHIDPGLRYTIARLVRYLAFS